MSCPSDSTPSVRELPLRHRHSRNSGSPDVIVPITVGPTGQSLDDFCDGISNFRAGLNGYVEIMKSLANCWKFRHVVPLFRVPPTFPNCALGKPREAADFCRNLIGGTLKWWSENSAGPIDFPVSTMGLRAGRSIDSQIQILQEEVRQSTKGIPVLLPEGFQRLYRRKSRLDSILLDIAATGLPQPLCHSHSR